MRRLMLLAWDVSFILWFGLVGYYVGGWVGLWVDRCSFYMG